MIIFTLGPDADTRRRALRAAAGAASERDLRAACLHAAAAAGFEAGCQVAVASPTDLVVPGADWIPQGGGSFGARIARAATSTDGSQVAPLVIVGADHPGLRGAHVGRALALLKGHPTAAVLGPSRDGGVYLIAAIRPLSAILHNVKWGAARTRAGLCEALRVAGFGVLLIEPLDDLDRPSDLERWLARPRSSKSHFAAVRRQLRLAMRRRRRPILCACVPVAAPVPRCAGARPPPSL